MKPDPTSLILHGSEQVHALPHVHLLLPEPWFTVKTRLEALAQTQDAIADDAYRALCDEDCIYGKESQHNFLSLRHDPNRMFLLPGLWPKAPSSISEWTVALVFQFRYNVSPADIMARFIAGRNGSVLQSSAGRSSIVVKEGGNLALIEADSEEGKILIRIIGDVAGRSGLLSTLRAEFKVIHETFAGLEVHEEVPVPNHPDQAVNYESLLQIAYNGASVLRLPGLDEPLSIAQLLTGVPESEDDALTRGRRPNTVASVWGPDARISLPEFLDTSFAPDAYRPSTDQPSASSDAVRPNEADDKASDSSGEASLAIAGGLILYLVMRTLFGSGTVLIVGAACCVVLLVLLVLKTSSSSRDADRSGRSE